MSPPATLKRCNLAGEYCVTGDIRASCVLRDGQANPASPVRRPPVVRVQGRFVTELVRAISALQDYKFVGGDAAPRPATHNPQCMYSAVCPGRRAVNLLFARPSRRDKYRDREALLSLPGTADFYQLIIERSRIAHSNWIYTWERVTGLYRSSGELYLLKGTSVGCQ